MTTDPTFPRPESDAGAGGSQTPHMPQQAPHAPHAPQQAPHAPHTASPLGPASRQEPVPAPSTAAASASQAPRKRTGPRTSPIVFGALILAFCAYVATRTFGTGTLDTAGWVTTVVIGLGVLLLIVSGAILLRGNRRD